jgi:ribose transport system permease protein
MALHAGVVTGLAGMVGSGRSEPAMASFGGLPMESGTSTCRYIYDIGDDRASAELLGPPVRRVTVLVYALSGFFAAPTAIYLVARFGTGQPYAGADYTLASETPVVVGGTMLSGGRGGVIGSLLGAYLIALLNDILNFLCVCSQVQLVVQGLIIMLVVSVYRERRKIA